MMVREVQDAFHSKDRVRTTSTDYTFVGIIVAYFPKRNGNIRCVVENDDGILHIFNPKQLEFAS